MVSAQGRITLASLDISDELAEKLQVAARQHGIAPEVLLENWLKEENGSPGNLFRELIDHTSDLIALHQPDWTFLYVNPASRTLLGYEPDELIGRALFDLIYVEDVESIRLRLQNLSTVDRIIYRIPRKDGQPVWLQSQPRLILNEAGNVERVITSSQDISDRKQLEAEIVRLLNQDSSLNSLKSRFVAGVSHEFRTPLTTILSSAELLRRYYERLNEEQRRGYLDKIVDQVHHMTGLLNDVLTINESETGMDFDPQPVELDTLCKDIVAEVSRQSPDRHDIHYRSRGDCDKVLADPALLTTILTHLLTNAIKYSPMGGDVNLEVTCEAQVIMIRVRDEGIGIPAGDKAGLFNKFYRARNVSTIPGVGLGLTIVRRAAEAHGGTVDVSSTSEHGTTFTVILPRQTGNNDKAT